MLSAGLAVEPAHRVGHGLGPTLGGGLGAGLGAALGAGLGPPAQHHMLAFTGGEFLRPLPPHRPGEPGPGAAMFSPPDLRYWLHHQQQQHMARYAASHSVNHHRLPASPTSSPQSAPPPPAPSPAPVNLTAPHKDDKERMSSQHGPHGGHGGHGAQHNSMGYHYPHYPMAAPMFPPAPYSPYASRLPPPADAPVAYSPPAASPAPLHPPPAPKPAVASKTFKVPVASSAAHSAGKEGSLKHRILTQPKHPVASMSAATPMSSISTSIAAPAPLVTTATTTTTPHSLPMASVAQDYHHLHHHSSQTPITTSAAAANTQPQFWKGSLIRLASGELRRVQEMKAEDFVASAERNPTLKADPAAVVRITSLHSWKVSVVLGVGGSESEIETTSEHPFFVYNSGWASCSPERSHQLLGLSCRQLQVGDVVMSLTHRQQPQPKQQQQQQQHQQQQHQQHQPQHRPTQKAPTSAAPRRPTKKQQQQQQREQQQQQQQREQQQQQQQQREQQQQQQQQREQQHQLQQQQLQQQHREQLANLLPPPSGHPRIPHLPGPSSAPPPSPSSSSSTGAPSPGGSGDASSSSASGKKRRWSAPDQLAAAAEEANAAHLLPKLARVLE